MQEISSHAVIEKERTLPQKKQRVLWLINHTTLREFEVHLLLSLGYEVYTPKIIPNFIKDWSGSVTYEYDSSLTLPKEILELLNQHDFYQEPIRFDFAKILDEYFGSAFCVFHPTIFQNITSHFSGHILLRAFGLDKTKTYGGVISQEYRQAFVKQLKNLGNKFWFSQAYDNLADVEPDFLKKRSIYHPLGLPESFFKHKDTWKGTEKKILFFCPRIGASPDYYGEIYHTFKKHFGDLPHLIAGNQPKPVNDKNVVGFQPRENVEAFLRDFAVMFYHSDEPRHLHYHPLEAIIFGIPLIYMRGGILEQLGGDDQPGACTTYKEAREKIKRILTGDELFVANIKRHQQCILKYFSFEHNFKTWEKNFTKEVFNTPITSEKISRTIGIFVPIGYKGGTLTAAKNIAKMLHHGSNTSNDKVKIVFSCYENIYDIESEFADLIQLGITIRETKWKMLPQKEVALIQQISGYNKPLYHSHYLLPTDGINNFNDCDYWLIISDRLHCPLAPIKPYGMVIYDYIQRYVPEILNNQPWDNQLFSSPRLADFVLCTTPSTHEDILQYAGVSAEKVHLIPMEFEAPKTIHRANKNDGNNYIIWPTNTAQHKNHLRTLEALLTYYNELDGKFDVIITGANTELLDVNSNNLATTPYIENIKNFIAKNPVLKKHLKVAGNLNRTSYEALLASAKFLLHPTLIDNGTFSVIEAAYLNIPAVCSSYVQMKYINKRFSLNLEFFDAYDPKDIASSIKNMEINYQQQQEKLPLQPFLEQFSYKNIAPEFWRIFRSLI